jgi:Zn-dependent M28 family amino/carboxypeptidase
MKNVFALLITTCLLTSCNIKLLAQCCSAGSGSPIAGGTSQGVLEERQAEINLNFQHITTSLFLKGDSPADDFLKNYQSNYNYDRFAYGVTKSLTMSVETGYYFNKTQTSLDDKKMESSGMGDLMLFPRYKIYSSSNEKRTNEITLGLGMKLPLGKYNDSLSQTEPFSGMVYYIPKPPVVQPSTGSQDFIFYSFFYKGFPAKNARIFANALYIKKGWNPRGEKFGDYTSIGLFAGKTFFHRLGTLIQLKGEIIDTMSFNKDAFLMGTLMYDVEATGSKKVFLVPQISYVLKKNLTCYLSSELPVYQYVNKTQIASQTQIMTGVAYRFYSMRNKE